MIKDRAAIVGIGQTAFGKGLPDSELSLACQAMRAALEDAGIKPEAVDGLASYTMEGGREVNVARNLGLGEITFFSQVGYGGGAGGGTITHAAMAVATGQADVVLTWRARKRAARASRPWSQQSK
ncbi:MAG: lipid-transfer protein, partial [Actinobacteria bacterium]